jgi:hypothetical protein
MQFGCSLLLTALASCAGAMRLQRCTVGPPLSLSACARRARPQDRLFPGLSQGGRAWKKCAKPGMATLSREKYAYMASYSWAVPWCMLLART